MRYGINVPIFGDYGDGRTLADLAVEAEAAGWDGFFLWDHLQAFDPAEPTPVADPWVALTAVALATKRIRLGPMVTPLARYRPWRLARVTATLDHLSNGRLILGVGLGEPADAEFAAFGEDADARARAVKLDEGLAVLPGLWSGVPFHFSGQVYQVRETTFWPPRQRPRIPIWVGGQWPHRAPLRRAARWDGVFPIPPVSEMRTLTPAELAQAVAEVRAHRVDAGPFDVVVAGETPGDDSARAAAIVAPYTAAGLTWWHEQIHGWRGPLAAMRERIRQGPPHAQPAARPIDQHQEGGVN